MFMRGSMFVCGGGTAGMIICGHDGGTDGVVITIHSGLSLGMVCCCGVGVGGGGSDLPLIVGGSVDSGVGDARHTHIGADVPLRNCSLTHSRSYWKF